MFASHPRYQDGYGATAKIREHEQATGSKRTPIIGLDPPMILIDSRLAEVGLDGMINKPIRFFNMTRTIVETMDRYDQVPEDLGGPWVLVEAIQG